jgi:hypothetical protein
VRKLIQPVLAVLIASVLGFGMAPAAHAADAATDAIQAAYAPYREALFRTNSKSQTESERALAAARAAWRQVRDRFAGRAPVPYDRDKQFDATLSTVDGVYARAEAEIGQQQLAKAHETLEEVRDLLGALRQRNGVVTFSDHINAYHEQMEKVLTQGPRWIETPAGLIELTLETGALDHLAHRLVAEADAQMRQSNAAFATALSEVQASSAHLRAAVVAQDAAAARKALSELKPPFSRLFLRFG